MQELHYCRQDKKRKKFETVNQTLKMKLCDIRCEILKVKACLVS